MFIECKSCSKKFIAKDIDIPNEGRMVQCGYCSTTWHQMPVKILTRPVKSNINESLSVDKIMASDGKTYKFLGSQWAELLPSGKSGLFAKRKIGKELDRLTGRKERSTIQKRQKKIKEVEIDTIEKVINPSSGSRDVVDPSSENLGDEKLIPRIDQPKQGLGFLGYFFLLIIIGFSIVGVLRTFENDLLNNFPETKYIFELMNEQLEYISETVKIMILIIEDLINSY